MAQIAALAAFFAGAGWVGLYLWMHFKCLGAINTLEQQCTVPQSGQGRYSYVPEDAEKSLEEAGCRGYLYIINSLKTYKNPAYAVIVTELLRRLTNPANDGVTDPKATPLRPPFPQLAVIGYQDQAPERDAKVLIAQKWWQENAKKYHQGWRVWTDHCPVPKTPGAP